MIIYFKDIVLSRNDILLTNMLKHSDNVNALRLFETGVILETLFEDKLSHEKFIEMIRGLDIRGISEHKIIDQWLGGNYA